MAEKTLVPPEQNTFPKKSTGPGALSGTGYNADYGQQISSFTELKQGKKTGELFQVGTSPLRVD